MIERLEEYVRGALGTSGSPSIFGDDVSVDQILDSITQPTTEIEPDGQTQPEDGAAGHP